jgi:thioredoxin reductase
MLPVWQTPLATSDALATLGGMEDRWDCVIVGGGAAGLSAALVLGRARRRTLVIDAGEQSNLPSHGIGGLLGADTMAPADFYNKARAEVSRYDAVRFRDAAVTDGAREAGDGDFVLTLADGSTERARRVLLAPGMTYTLPEVAGLAERWGGSVFHCPFCHGYEHRDQALAVLDDGDGGALHRALLLRNWSEDTTLLTNGPASLEDADRARLDAAGISVDERPIAEVRDGEVAFADGTTRPCGGLLVPVELRPRTDLATRLGATLSDEVTPIHFGAIVVAPTDHLQAAGDVTGAMPSVANAVAAGSTAAAAIVGSLAGAF